MKKNILSFLVPMFAFSVTAQAQIPLPLFQYQGSSFAEVLNVLEDHNFTPQADVEKKEFAVYQNRLPQYPMNMTSVFFSSGSKLEIDAIRTVSERFDYYDRIPKKLHPNGVCVTGEWKISEPTKYTGYFAEGSTGLFVGRISVAMEETTSDDARGFGFAGKVFPTTDVNEIVKTGNFFTVDVLMGEEQERVLDTATTNEPEVGFRFNLLAMAMKLSSALKKADENPMFRPLTQVAALGRSDKIKQPQWIRLSVDSSIRRNNEKDFRMEVLKSFEENTKLIYNIEVSDTTKDRSAKKGWNKIGQITLDNAVVSYGCDRRLHFAHPKLK